MSAIEDRVAKLKVSLPASSYILILKKKWWGGNHTAIMDNEGKNKACWWRGTHNKIVD